MNILTSIQPQSFKSAIRSLFAAAIIIFIAISSLVIEDKLNNFVRRAHVRAWMLEHHINSKFLDSHQIMRGLSNSLVNQQINRKNPYIKELVDNFNSDVNCYKSIPFYGFKIFDTSHLAIYHTLVPNHLFVPLKSVYDINLLDTLKEHPLSFQVGPIRMGTMGGEEIIPFCIGISKTANTEYIGSICSGLKVKELDQELNNIFSTQYHDKMRLKNKYSVDKNRPEYSVDNVFTITNMIKYYLYDENFTVIVPLSNYPFIIEVELHFHLIIIELITIILYCLAYFCLFIIFTYFLYLIHKKFYQIPLSNLEIKASAILNNDNKPSFRNFKISNFIKITNDLLNKYKLIHSNNKKELENDASRELQHNIVNLVLAERSSRNSYKSSNVSLESLYSNQLKKLVNEDKQTSNLTEFLANIARYCYEYNPKLNIKVVVNKNDNKDFNFKHAALTETIFNIFALITRISKFDTNNIELTLKATFYEQNQFPTISIESNISDVLFDSLNWTMGNSYVYNGFLSIYALTRYNNLLFSIKHDEQQLIFMLEPINN